MYLRVKRKREEAPKDFIIVEEPPTTKKFRGIEDALSGMSITDSAPEESKRTIFRRCDTRPFQSAPSAQSMWDKHREDSVRGQQTRAQNQRLERLANRCLRARRVAVGEPQTYDYSSSEGESSDEFVDIYEELSGNVGTTDSACGFIEFDEDDQIKGWLRQRNRQREITSSHDSEDSNRESRSEKSYPEDESDEDIDPFSEQDSSEGYANSVQTSDSERDGHSEDDAETWHARDQLRQLIASQSPDMIVEPQPMLPTAMVVEPPSNF